MTRREKLRSPALAIAASLVALSVAIAMSPGARAQQSARETPSPSARLTPTPTATPTQTPLPTATPTPAATPAATPPPAERPPIVGIDPPEQGFYAKKLDFHGIPIKASSVVADEALYAAYDRLAMELAHLPTVIANLAAAGAQLHIIGRDQVTSDLPEFRDLKGKPLPEYHGLTVDQRTRGLGGLWTSCGEENLLKLDKDRYRGRDICLHEFAHCIEDFGIPHSVREKLDAQYRRSLKRGLWKGSYAGSNPSEFFAELTMWYFGTHGDMHMVGPKPAVGRDGLRQYDPGAFRVIDDFYSGRIPIARVRRKGKS